jgi:hypothetical protein
MDEETNKINKAEGKAAVGELTILKKLKDQSASINEDKNPKITPNLYLKDDYFENMINQIIRERCPEEKLDLSIKNSAIKRY